MDMTEIMNLPVVKDAIRQKNEEERKAALAARIAVLKELNEVEALLEKKHGAVSAVMKKIDDAMVALQTIRNEAAVVEAERNQASSRYQHLLEKLRKEHGEHFVSHAIVRLTAYLDHLTRERDRLNGICVQLREVIPGFVVKQENPKARTSLDAVTREITSVILSLNMAKELERAELTPQELEEKSIALLKPYFTEMLVS